MAKEKIYRYSAMDAQGKERKGNVYAMNETEANSKIKEQGLFPTSIVKTGEGQKVVIEKVEKNSHTLFQITLFGLRLSLEKV